MGSARTRVGFIGAGVIGASSMVFDQVFSRTSIARWIEAGDPASIPNLPLLRAG